MRIKQLKEDASTIRKAMIQISTMNKERPTGLTTNQSVRWVMVKEDHASHIINTVAEYFLCQRVRSTSPRAISLC
jgi:nickel superoxide dismutase